MGMSQVPAEESEDGGFERQDDEFRDWVEKHSGAKFPAAAGRYHLYVSLACPWAHRTLIARRLLGLEEVIGVTVAAPVRDGRGWAFRDGEGHSEDPVNGFRFLAEAYRASRTDWSGRATVPVLWDRESGRIVNNSEDDICRMMQGAFAAFQTRRVELFPAALSAAQDALSREIYEDVNNGVYRAGFASRQQPYERAVARLFARLDELEDLLAPRRFLFGEAFAETDWRLFCTLIRFDPVYHGHFKCNVRRIVDYPNLLRFLRDLYHWPGIAETVNFDHIKRHYYVTHEDINPTRIVPVGPDLGYLDR